MMRTNLALAGTLLCLVPAVASAQSTPTAPQKPTVPTVVRKTPPPPPVYGQVQKFRDELDFYARNQAHSSAVYASAHAIAGCIRREAGKDSGALIGGALDNDPRFGRLSKALAGKYSNCSSAATIGVPLIAVNAALAEEIVRARAPSLPRYSREQDVATANAFYAADGRFTIDNLGRCVAAYSPGLVDQFLATRPRTPSENAALATVYAETPACNVRTVPASIPVVEQRNALATGLYAWLNRG